MTAIIVVLWHNLKEIDMARVALCEVSGLLKDALDKLSGENGSEWAERLKLALRKNDLLRRVAEVFIGSNKKFVVADHFRIGNAGIAHLDENFNNNFLGKVEHDIPATTLIVSSLERISSDNDIRRELGAYKEQTSLDHLFQLLKRQSRGESSGVLLTNGYQNVFYIRDINQCLWAIGVSYGLNGCWCIEASSVARTYRWYNGSRIFSCK